MWKLKENVTIVDKKAGLLINSDLLAKNQSLAEIVLQDESLRAKWGHNFIQVGEHKKQPVKNELEIEVNVKKKEVVLKESKAHVSTSTEAKTGGMNLNVSEGKQESKSGDSQPLNRRERRAALSKGK